MKRVLVFLLLLLVLGISSFTILQDTVRYHKIRYTTTNVILEAYNMSVSDTLKQAFVKEYIDGEGRTRELRFYECNHQLHWPGSGFTGGPIIKYDYKDHKIIETFFVSDSEIANDFATSEVPFQHIYFLNNKNEIIDVEQFYKINFKWNNESLDSASKHLEKYKKFKPDEDPLKMVFGYKYAYAKYDGINPVVKE